MPKNVADTPLNDFGNVELGDKRLDKRLKKYIEERTKSSEKSILGISGGRSGGKAIYRLLANAKFKVDKLLKAVSNATKARMSGDVLLIQDTMDVNLNGHKKTKDLGYSSEHVLGVKVHSCIALKPEGVPIGLVDQSYETRTAGKSKLSKTERASRPIEEKESFRWIEMLRESTKDIPEEARVITICDREGDFYELYAEASTLETDFIIRVTHDRKNEDDEKVVTKLRETEAIGRVEVQIPRDSRRGKKARVATMEVAHLEVTIPKPKIIKADGMPSKVTMNFVRITEIDPPEGQEPIEWILATSLPTSSVEEVMFVVECYVQRWKIERFHFVLKSGLGAEKIQQRSYERIKPILLIYSVIALFIMAVTYLGRLVPNISCDLFLTDDEWRMLHRIIHKKTKKKVPNKPYSLAEAVSYLGELGSYKRAPSDGPPGLKSIWKGLFRLYEFMDMFPD